MSRSLSARRQNPDLFGYDSSGADPFKLRFGAAASVAYRTTVITAARPQDRPPPDRFGESERRSTCDAAKIEGSHNTVGNSLSVCINQWDAAMNGTLPQGQSPSD